jgi:hypothetical protein
MLRKILLTVLVLILIALIFVPLCVPVPKRDINIETATTNTNINNKMPDALFVITSSDKNSVTAGFSEGRSTSIIMSDIPVTVVQAYLNTDPDLCAQQDMVIEFDPKITIKEVTDKCGCSGYRVTLCLRGDVNASIGDATPCKTGHCTVQKMVMFINAEGQIIHTVIVSADVQFTSSSIEVSVNVFCPSNVATAPRPDCGNILLGGGPSMSDGRQELTALVTNEGYIITISNNFILKQLGGGRCGIYVQINIVSPHGATINEWAVVHDDICQFYQLGWDSIEVMYIKFYLDGYWHIWQIYNPDTDESYDSLLIFARF